LLCLYRNAAVILAGQIDGKMLQTVAAQSVKKNRVNGNIVPVYQLEPIYFFSYDGSFLIFFYAYESQFYDAFFFYHKAYCVTILFNDLFT
jgi:hypothetical protein